MHRQKMASAPLAMPSNSSHVAVETTANTNSITIRASGYREYAEPEETQPYKTQQPMTPPNKAQCSSPRTEYVLESETWQAELQ